MLFSCTFPQMPHMSSPFAAHVHMKPYNKEMSFNSIQKLYLYRKGTTCGNKFVVGHLKEDLEKEEGGEKGILAILHM